MVFKDTVYFQIYFFGKCDWLITPVIVRRIMTLVIAKKIGNFIQIASDSKLTSEDQTYRNPYMFGALKTIIVGRHICISFAGTVQRGEINYPNIAFEKIYKDDDISFSNIVDILERVHNDSGCEIDFIVGYQNNETTELIKIQDGAVHVNGNNYWIGDINGFNFFQQCYLENRSGLELNIDDHISLITDSFVKVVNNESISGIDGLVVNVFGRNGYFEYMPGYNLDVHKKTIIKPNEDKTLPFGEAEDGSFGIAYFVNEKDSPPALATFFPQGKMGILYFPQLSLKKIYIKDVTDSDFVKIVANNYGIELRGFLLDLQKGIAKYIGKDPGRFRLAWDIHCTANYQVEPPAALVAHHTKQLDTPSQGIYVLKKLGL